MPLNASLHPQGLLDAQLESAAGRLATNLIGLETVSACSWQPRTTAVSFQHRTPMRRLLGQLLLLVAAHGELVLHVVPPDAAAAPSSAAPGENEEEERKNATACGIRYTIVHDLWRAASNTWCTNHHGGWPIPTPNNKTMGDFPRSTRCRSDAHGSFQDTGVGGDRWYRFWGAGGNALALTPPRYHGPHLGCDIGPNSWPLHDRLYCGTSNQVSHYTSKPQSILLVAHVVLLVSASVSI